MILLAINLNANYLGVSFTTDWDFDLSSLFCGKENMSPVSLLQVFVNLYSNKIRRPGIAVSPRHLNNDDI